MLKEVQTCPQKVSERVRNEGEKRTKLLKLLNIRIIKSVEKNE